MQQLVPPLKWNLSIFLGIVVTLAFASLAWATPVPHYDIQVEYDADQKQLKGIVDISFSAADYPSDELLFALPMNRFLEQDPRGPRKSLIAPVFALDRFNQLDDDPLFPKGFNSGATQILKVSTLQGQELRYKIQNNPDLHTGFSTKDGLLRVLFDSKLSQPTIRIEFQTKLPQRYLEGHHKEELLTAQWHPILLDHQSSSWKTNLNEPLPGQYAVQWKSSRSGTLITTTGAFPYQAQETLTLPPSTRPLKYFPLIFSPNYRDVPLTLISPVSSFYLEGNKRRAFLLQEWGEEFLEFVQEKYHLELPWDKIFIVEVHGDNEQIRVMNNLILVTTPHYQRTGLLDRRVLGFFAQSLGELWFGETVWHNSNEQLWLSRGFGTFFSLRYYEHKYGSDAGIFDFIDWVNPRYREHFVESMARGIKPELQVPIVSPIQGNHKASETRILLRLATYKAALVLSMLEDYVGSLSFQEGLTQFRKNHSHQVATEQDLKTAMASHTSENLDYFFEQWFHTTNALDYAIGEVEEVENEEGGYEIRIPIERRAAISMPVQVVLETEDGQKHRQKTTGKKNTEVLTFLTDSGFEEASIDPEERLLELSRLNNHTSTHFRIRFAFDWKKQREVMSLLVPRVGSNAIDGNQIGLESNNSLGGGYSLSLTPGYGTKNNQFLYKIRLRKNGFFNNNTSASVNFSQIGGIISRGVGLSYTKPQHRDRFSYSFGFDLEQETVFRTDEDKDTDDDDPEESGDTSNFAVNHSGRIGIKNFYFPSYGARVEQPLTDLGADFNYTLLQTRISHLFNVGFRKRINWTWLYNTTVGNSPLQKKFQLGSPQVLRGYPQNTSLRDDQLLALRLDFEFPLISTAWWGNISSLGMQGSVFYDIGKVWENDSSFGNARQRQDVGVGVLWGVDTVALFQVPFKIELAYPIDNEDSNNDGEPDFNKPKFVVGGVLTFF